MKRSINKAELLIAVVFLAVSCARAKVAQESVSQVSVVTKQEVLVAKQTETVPEKQTSKPADKQIVSAPKTANATAVAKAEKLSPEQVLERLKAWDKNLLLLQTNFSQTTSYDGVEINRSHGVLFYNKDKHLLRLDTFDNNDQPVQSAVTDKKDLFILDDTGKQVMKLSWQEWQQNQPNQALFDFGNYTALLARHNIENTQPTVFKLTPKNGETYVLYLTLSPQDYFPQTLRLETDGVVTTADLTQIQKNKSLPKNTFQGVFK